MRGSSSSFMRTGLLGGGLGLTALAVIVSCGGGSSSSSGIGGGTDTITTIDSKGMSTALSDISAFLPICVSSTASATAADAEQVLSIEARIVSLARASANRYVGNATPNAARPAAISPTKPADVLGDCGGKYGYTTYTYVAGASSATLTATLAFSNYCSKDSKTGDKSYVNGSIDYVTTATAAGNASSFKINNASVAAKATTAADVIKNTQTIGTKNLSYVWGVPGGTPTSAKPDVMKFDELTFSGSTSGRNYRETNWSISSFQTASGGSQMTLSGRGYRSGGTYFDVATSAPIVTDSSGKFVSGAITITGTNTAVITVKPSTTANPNVVITIDGKVVTGMTSTCK